MNEEVAINDACSINRKWVALMQIKVFKLKLLEFILAVTLSVMMEVLPIKNPYCCLVAAPTVIVPCIIMILYMIDQCSTELEIYFLMVEMILIIVAIGSFYTVVSHKITIDYVFKMILVDLFLLMVLDLFAVRAAKGCIM